VSAESRMSLAAFLATRMGTVFDPFVKKLVEAATVLLDR
jgi:hypothetical protein